jgi:RNA polymerase sigma-70 factor (ECF subfamily)
VEKTTYYSGIKRYIASRIRNPEDAEDLAQRVFLEFYQNNNARDNLHNPKAYLLGIARNLVGHYYSQKDNKLGFLQIDTKTTDKISYDSYSKDYRTRESIEEIDNIISELPPKAREAVELRLIDSLSPQEAAQKLNCTVDRFYDRFHEGLKILREKIHTQIL